MTYLPWIIALTFDLVLRLGLCMRVIMRRLPVGTSLAWLTIILVFPVGGSLIYLLLGEKHLGRMRARRAAHLQQAYSDYVLALRKKSEVNWPAEDDAAASLSRLVDQAIGLPVMPGNHLQLLRSWEPALQSLIADIDAARLTCYLEFYIWNQGGLADDVVAAVIRAAQRGVSCKLLLDAVGSKEFLRGDLPRQMQAAGVELRAALPVGLVRMWFRRIDLRLHRKIAILDGRIGYTGSLNLVDPRFFKQDSGVGQWVDALVRVEGPTVEGLELTFSRDWRLESDVHLAHDPSAEAAARLKSIIPEASKDAPDDETPPAPPAGNAIVQVVPSGPEFSPDAIHKILLTTIYSAQHELVLTSPYFVPDEPLLSALTSAAQRGVAVTLIIPARVDSLMVRLASEANLGELLSAGVRVAAFTGGLLHTKSVTVDRRMALFGSLNLDPRSLWLNFEITLAVYDRQFTVDLRNLQETYLADATFKTLAEWQQRSFYKRFLDNAMRLLGPLL